MYFTAIQIIAVIEFFQFITHMKDLQIRSAVRYGISKDCSKEFVRNNPIHDPVHLS